MASQPQPHSQSQQSSATPTSATTPVGANASSSSSASAAPAATAANGSNDGTPKPQADAQGEAQSNPKDQAQLVRDKDSFRNLMVDRYLTHDFAKYAALVESQNNSEKLIEDINENIKEYQVMRTTHRHLYPPSVLYGEGYNGFGNGTTDVFPQNRNSFPSQLLYPVQKPRPGKKQTPALTWKKRDLKKQADQHEELVPIRIDVDWDKLKLRDTFTWNLHDRIVHPELFTHQMLEDLGLDPKGDVAFKPVSQQVIQQMQDQLMDFYPFAFSEEDALDPELPYSAYKNDEMRILIKLNITIGQHTLVDQFEWDINNPLNSPEEFAAIMSRDLCLAGEFTTAIAHCIREQSQLFTRSLYGVGHPFDGRPIEDPDLIDAFLPSPLSTVFRPQQQAKDYAPYLYELSESAIERNELGFSREQRRQKRSINRRGGPQLPDLKERQRTIRTLIMSSVLPGAATSMDETTLYKRAPGAPGASRKRHGARDGDASDSDDSEDSGPDSPAVSQLGGTARTRGLRGAASAAQQRMANLGRSETPEASVIHHHETRRNAGRFGGRELRDDTPEPTSLWVTLKVSKDKLRRLLQNPRARISRSSSQTPGTPSYSHTRAPSSSVGAGGSMPPPATPNASKANAPSSAQSSLVGAVPAPPSTKDQPQPPAPPPPEWLAKCLQQLRERYPHDVFDAIMRHVCVNPDTDATVSVPPGQPTPPGHNWVFVPRIKCRDCPSKSYNTGPDTTIDNFEKHLKLNSHRRSVDKRCGFDTKPKAPQPGVEG